MLTDHFYFTLLRKYVTIFGSLFDNINLVRIENGEEVKRIKVPLNYGPRDKYVTRLTADPDLYKSTAITLPRLSFEIASITYDPARQQNPLHKISSNYEYPERAKHQYMGVPYDINFNLYLYTKTIDDGNHIVEQILPYFHPDFTVTTKPVPDLGFLKDIPIVLNGINQEVSYEGNWESTRFIIWQLQFTLKAYFFGPITTPKIIRKSIANIFNDPSLVTGYIIRINTTAGNNGTFGIKDVVYQGNNYETAEAYGITLDWNEDTGRLMIGGTQGQFRANATIRSASSNASYKIASFDATPLKLAQVIVEPDPISANSWDDYGYTESITEFPETMEE